MLHSKLVWRSFCDKKKLKILFRGHILLVILKVNESLERFTKESQKASKKEFRVEKVVKTKSYKLYVKWKGNDNSFNSWIDKKDIV